MSEEPDNSLIQTDSDYINVRRYKNSLKVVELRYPNGCPDHIVAACLNMSEEQINEKYLGIILLIKKELGIY